MKNSINAAALILHSLWCLCTGFEASQAQKCAARSVMEQIAECQFDRAVSSADSMIASDSSEPLFWMLKLSALALRQLDYAETSGPDDFADTYEKAEMVLETLEKGPSGRSSYLLTMKGFIRLVAASHAMHRKNYLTGLRRGLNAVSLCKDAKEIDSANADVDFVLGLNNYARAELKKKFWGMLFWYSGDKRSGIAAMERCSKNAQFVGFAAVMVLQDIYVREGMFDTAMEGTGRLLVLYPGCRFAMWSLAKLHDAQKQYGRAAQTYGRLADAYEKIPLAFRSAGITRFSQAQRFYLAGDMDGAEAACRRLLDLCKNRPCEECGDGEMLLKRITGGK